jgi:hypothetical protein
MTARIASISAVCETFSAALWTKLAMNGLRLGLPLRRNCQIFRHIKINFSVNGAALTRDMRDPCPPDQTRTRGIPDLIEEGTRAVGRSVIDDNQLEIRERLIQDRTECLGQVGPPLRTDRTTLTVGASPSIKN